MKIVSMFRLLTTLQMLLVTIFIEQVSSTNRTMPSVNEIRRLLFNGYEACDIPGMPVNVTASLNLLSLNHLDIKEQRLSVAAYFFFQWYDPRLEWLTDPDYSEFYTVRSVFSEEKAIWTPPIIIDNSVDEIDVISRPNIPIRVNGLGIVDWLPAGIFTTHCESTITYWPLDSQTCEVIISTWGVTSEEVSLDFGTNVMLSNDYQEHGEWELVSTSNKAMNTIRENMPFRRLAFSLTFRRRHLFHTLNTLLPVILFGFLTIVVFKLNPESGERVGLALTILLAYSVYLGLISESIPQTSLSASLLSTYLASILLLQTLSVLLTVIYLDIYFTSDEKPIPKWLHAITVIFLAKLTCNISDHNMAKVWPSPNDSEKNVTLENCETKGKEDAQRHKYTWKEISRMLDKVTMYIYTIFLFALTVIIAGVMIQHYSDSAS